ncbi:acyl-[acyl-carrier-protein] thioesterase [Breznakiellaceae bacterium SP9]
MKDIWQELFLVNFGHIDTSGRVTPAAVFEFFQNAAMNHAEDLNCGRQLMQETGQVWILSRMSVRITQRPALDEVIQVHTWPRGTEKLFAIRHYDIRDANGTVLVRARSGWIILDTVKRRPLRPQTLVDKLPPNTTLEALTGGLEAIEGSSALLKAATRAALYSDIDFNGHVNNVRYIQWLCDLLDIETLAGADTISIDINYLNEVHPGEQTDLYMAPINTDSHQVLSFTFEGRSQASGQACFRAALVLAGGKSLEFRA